MGKHQFALMLSAIFVVCFCTVSYMGFLLMMIMYQQQQLQLTHSQIILDINKVAAKLHVHTNVVPINPVIYMNLPSVYSQVSPGLEKGYSTRRVRVGSVFHVNSYRRLTKEGLLVLVIQTGLETNPRSCKQQRQHLFKHDRAKDLIFHLSCLYLYAAI